MRFLLTEPERRSLPAETERRVKAASPLAPRWLRRAIAERMVQRLSLALAEGRADTVARAIASTPTRGLAGQLDGERILMQSDPADPPRNPSPHNELTT